MTIADNALEEIAELCGVDSHFYTDQSGKHVRKALREALAKLEAQG